MITTQTKPFKCPPKFLSVQFKNLFRSKGRKLDKRKGRKQIIFFFLVLSDHFVALRFPSVFALF